MATEDSVLSADTDPRGTGADEGLGRAALLARMFDERAAPRAGRFVLMERVGAGAMGTVWAAYDGDLDRRVAVKLLHPAERDHEDDARVLEEARVLASVNHPNVVHVYEVGDREGRIFIAMEFVEGPTLREWVAERERSWSDVLAKYLQAARGLAAAHDAGVVHRDFKPDNALVGSDGRVRVVDFGLAGHDAVAGTQAQGDSVGTAGSTRRQGGTPSYASPEQLRGEETDGRGDQFSLCVSLFEALAKQRPFDGTDRNEPSMDRLPSVVPGSVRSGLRRGLSRDAGDRFASMHHLIAALDRGSDRVRRRLAVLGGLGLVLVGGVALGRSTVEADAPCRDPRQQLDGVWDDQRRQAVHDSLAAAAPSYGDATATNALSRLDAYADEWVAGHRDACEATHVRHEQSEALLDARVRCLMDRRRNLTASIDLLAAADREVAENAIELVEGLPPVSACADIERAQASHPSPNDAEAVDAELERLARTRALLGAGRFDVGLQSAREGFERAAKLDYPPLQSRAQRLLGRALGKRGDIEAARQNLEAAYRGARRSRQDDVAAQAASDLASLFARHTTRYDAAKSWADLASLEGEIVGNLDVRASGRNSYGIASSREGDLVTAEASFREAVELLEPEGETPTLLGYRTNRARNAWNAGRFEEALASASENLEAAVAILGPDHPHLLAHYSAVTGLLQVLDRPAEAKPMLVRAVEIAKAAHGDEHPHPAAFLETLGGCHLALGELSAARETFEQAVAVSEATSDGGVKYIYGLAGLAELHMQIGESERALELYRRNVESRERTVGPSAQATLVAQGQLARALLEAGRPEEALPLAEAVVSGMEEAFGRTHAYVGEALWVRARTLAELDRLDEAAGDLERAITIFDETFSPDSPKHAGGLMRLAEIRLRQGRGADALSLAERTMELVEDVWPPAQLAEAQFLLARSLVAAGRDPQRATVLAATAAAALRGGPDPTVAKAADIEAWVEERCRHGIEHCLEGSSG